MGRYGAIGSATEESSSLAKLATDITDYMAKDNFLAATCGNIPKFKSLVITGYW